MIVKKSLRVCMILKRAKKMTRLGLEDEVIGFKEGGHLSVILCSDPLPESSPIEEKMTNGDIFIIQTRVNDNDSAFSFVREFLIHIQNA